MSPRVYERRFDWDEARRRFEQGETKTSIARALGVSPTAIYLATKPGAYERSQEHSRAWTHAAHCVDCGTPVTRNRKSDERRCTRCCAISQATTVTPTTLQCFRCKEWKPDEAFPHNRAERGRSRRGRHTSCRPCQTIQRREHRERNREAENAYQRLYKRRKRQEARDG